MLLLLVVRPRLRADYRTSFPCWAQLDEDAIRDCTQGDPRAARIRVLSALAVRSFLYMRRAVDLGLTALSSPGRGNWLRCCRPASMRPCP
ncbi:hypothetical protein [Streptomyces sp. LN549]|uniref:hypothetical protein n=1 Tax=Streptomyces sp. LN549 TaxID=3112979 RepID=UPI0037127CFD